MPIASPETYAAMLDAAKRDRFAYPAINVASSSMLIGALRGFTEAESDGIVQVSFGGAEHLSGATVKDLRAGAEALAEYARIVAERYPVNIALHTDHCAPEKLEGFLKPLLAVSQARIARGQAPLFQSHMWDGATVALDENLQVAEELLDECAAAQIILEVEIGVVGGEEDGISHDADDKLYSTPDDALRTAQALGLGERGRYMLAATFGNVHGVYEPGNVQLRPSILGDIQRVVGEAHGRDKPFDLVFHGGSGSEVAEIRETLDYGVVKMNVDSDTQYAYTRAVADHVLRNYDGVLKVDGEVGSKKAYDCRTWMKLAEGGMAARIVQACEALRSTGTTLGAT
jgi:fructose-bisphosphate aldolase class II